MQKKVGFIFCCFILGASSLTYVLAEGQTTEELDPITVIVSLSGKANLSQLSTDFESHRQRTQTVFSAIDAYNKKAFLKLSPILDAHPNEVFEVVRIPIINAVRVTAMPNVISELQANNAIENITVETPKKVSELGQAKASLWNSNPDETEVSWAVHKVRAPELWESNTKGEGVVTAVIDTGAATNHLDLAPSLWNNPGETGLDAAENQKESNGIDDDNNGYIDDVHGWNFQGKNNDLTDTHGHGSATAGIVGGVGTEGIQTGVAPNAKLMIIKSCCGADTTVFESDTILGMQYAIQQGARVISMSLSVKWYSNPNYALWREASEVMLAAGIVHINSAGNLGSDKVPENVGAPATNPPAWLNPLQAITGGLTSMITIGATDQEDAIRSYSSTGPVTWQNIEGYNDYAYDGELKLGLTKPEVCGPSEMPSLAKSGKGYIDSFGGTSSATPAVAGVATLLLSARPDLTVAQVTETLQLSAVRVGDAFNNQCGAGRVDAVEAVNYANHKFPLK